LHMSHGRPFQAQSCTERSLFESWSQQLLSPAAHQQKDPLVEGFMMNASRTVSFGPLIAITGVVAALLWGYWTTLGQLVEIWSRDPQYSHGYVVPLFALGLFWLRRNKVATVSVQRPWWAVLFIFAGCCGRLVGAYFYSPWLDYVSLLPILAGISLAVGGSATLRQAWPAIAFLLFMIPLPGRLDKLMASPLQRIATLASTNALQTFGFFAQADGNVIVLSEVDIGIVEACSGLRMLVVFLATSTAVAILIRRSLLQRILIVLSAVPIALFCNIVRIIATGILHETADHELASFVYHDVAGWLMAPAALALLGIELIVFRHLFLVTGSAGSMLIQPEVRPSKPIPKAPSARSKFVGRLSLFH
jgi:exosortase